VRRNTGAQNIAFDPNVVWGMNDPDTSLLKVRKTVPFPVRTIRVITRLSG